MMEKWNADFRKKMLDLSNQLEGNLGAAIKPVLANPGKCIRPYLCYLSAQLGTAPDVRVDNQCLAIELFHLFSLVHDDVMDESPLRRGQPSLYAKYGANRAILAGDYLLIWTFELLSKEQDEPTAQIVRAAFERMAKDLCHGQWLDLDTEQLAFPSLDMYLEMIKNKTAVLIGTSLEIGAHCAKLPKNIAAQLYEFGLNMGMAFQIQDDLLDLYGQEAMIGKVVGGDVRQSKKNVLAIMANEALPEDKKQYFHALYNEKASDEKVDAVTQLYHELRIRTEVEKLRDSYAQKAEQMASSIQDQGYEMERLINFIEQLSKRNK